MSASNTTGDGRDTPDEASHKSNQPLPNDDHTIIMNVPKPKEPGDPRNEVEECLTQFIQQAQVAEPQALDVVFREAADQIHTLAKRCLFVGKEGETFQATALMDEAFVFLSERRGFGPEDRFASRQDFFRYLAKVMESILRDYWRKKNALKRGGGNRPLALDEAKLGITDINGLINEDQSPLIDALKALEEAEPRQAEVIRLRYFLHHAVTDVAQCMELAESTVKEDTRRAIEFLRTHMQP